MKAKRSLLSLIMLCCVVGMVLSVGFAVAGQGMMGTKDYLVWGVFGLVSGLFVALIANAVAKRWS